ncbi:protein spaetzle 5-like [Diabrotica undecimpunctata]|uniref:protein spaetzle 5-like n=1 Tax=Diabrotica undecimpunctata TaxID=50387 RepID=UPI003B6403D9
MRLNIGLKLTIWLANLVVYCSSVCSPHYGAEPCKYDYTPAPPGKTPPCARPGLTYCEYPEQYPGQLIHYLVKTWKYDHQSLFSSESKEDFDSYYYPTTSPVYGPPNYRPPYTGRHHGGYPEPIYIPKPQIPFQENAYIPPSYHHRPNYTNYHDTSGGYHYGPPNKANIYYQPYQQALEHHPQYGQYNSLWKRALDQNHRRYKRSLRKKRVQPLVPLEKFANGTLHRSKRQAADQPVLCRTRVEYITPRAALNNKGNWRYVVNMPEVNRQVTQLVKAELCVSNTCDGICTLPDNYVSKCEQKYVQKRLVALGAGEGAGELYTDLFWFPSCCLCTLQRVDN